MAKSCGEPNALSDRSAAPRPRNPRSTRFIALSLGALLVALIPCPFALSQYPPPLGTRRLPDGSVISLEAVTYGTTHQFFHGTWGQRIAHALLPAAWADRLGGAVLTHDTRSPQLVCWLRRSGPSGAGIAWRIRGHVRVAGEDECQCGWDSVGWHGWVKSGGQYSEVGAAEISSFPRRRTTMHVRLCRDLSLSRKNLLAEFVVPNPAPGPYPVWTPEPLPVTRRNGAVAVTLVDLVTGLRSSPLIAPKWEREWTRARLRIRPITPRGQSIAPSRSGLSDATGNDSNSATFSRRADGDWDCWFLGRLCADEPAVKLRIEYARDALTFPAPGAGVQRPNPLPLDPGTVWALRDLPVPRVGREYSSRSVVRQGVEIHLDGVERGSGREAGTVTISARVNTGSVVPKLRLSLARATDQRGRRLELRDFWSEDDPEGDGASHTYTLSLLPGSSRVNLLFRLNRTSVVEFTVRPRTGP